MPRHRAASRWGSAALQAPPHPPTPPGEGRRGGAHSQPTPSNDLGSRGNPAGVASFSQTMGPWRTTATPLTRKITPIYRTCSMYASKNIMLFSNLDPAFCILYPTISRCTAHHKLPNEISLAMVCLPAPDVFFSTSIAHKYVQKY